MAQAFNDMARRLEDYETADGTPRIDSSGPLNLVTSHHRPGAEPAATTAASTNQRHLATQLQQQIRQLQRTAETLLRDQG